MPWDTLTPAQQGFIEQYLKRGFFSKSSDNRKIDHFSNFLDQKRAFATLYGQLPEGTPGRGAAAAQRDAAIENNNNGKFKRAHTGIDKAMQALQDADRKLRDRKTQLLQKINALRLEANATPAEAAFLAGAQDAAQDALAAERPTPADFVAAEAEWAKALRLKMRSGDLKDLADRNPHTAAAAQASLDNMRAITGGGFITPERIDKAKAEKEEAERQVDRLTKALKKGRRRGFKTDTGGVDLVDADNRLTRALADAKRLAADKKALETALKGTQMLTAALEEGPLSGKRGGHQMPDDAIQALIAGYEVNPELADDAVYIADAALDPVAVARAIPQINTQIENGFADDNGNIAADLNPENYGRVLLQAGGTCGQDYFDRLDDYVSLGGLVAVNPLLESPDDSRAQKEQKRAIGAAKGMIDTATGRLALGSDAAKLGVGQMLFHPDAIFGTPTPILSKHTLETIAFLSTPPNDAEADRILTGITAAPTNGGPALVNLSLGTDATTNPIDDTRTAVVSAMLQPVDQGPIGSCFATGPVRQTRQLEPLAAMETFAELATTGEYTASDGSITPAITNLPPGEDPLIRAFEYTLATKIGRDDTLIMQKEIERDVETAKARFQAELSKSADALVAYRAIAMSDTLAYNVRDRFTPVYDPTVDLGDTRTDGRSKYGGYVMEITNGTQVTQITDRAAYLAQVKTIALDTYGYDAASPEGMEVVAAIEGPFMAALDNAQRPPWHIGAGGYGPDAREALKGTATLQDAVVEIDHEPNTPAEIGARTKDILGGLMSKRGTAPDDMIQLDVNGIHTMNFLPNHPSMVDLLAAPGATVEDKIDGALAGPGAILAATPLSAVEAQELYDGSVQPLLRKLEKLIEDDNSPKDDMKRFKTKVKELRKRIVKHRPTEPTLPRDIQERVRLTVDEIYLKPEKMVAFVQTELAKKYSDPVIVIADTNWGNGQFHAYMVMAPDPISGQPMLWQKIDPSGEMKKMESKWLVPSWSLVK